MRWFLVALVLNLALLFMPLSSTKIHSKDKQSMSISVVSLNPPSRSSKHKDSAAKAPPRPDPLEEIPYVESILEPAPVLEPRPVQEPVKKAQKMPKKISPKKPKKPILSPSTQPQTENASPTENESPKKSTSNPSTGNTSSLSESTKSSAEVSDNGCVVGVDILKEKDRFELGYPRAAISMRIVGDYKVDVVFRLKKGGGIEILTTRQKPNTHPVFINAAKQMAKKMNIKALTQKAYECDIVQGYEFNQKR